MFLKTYVPLDKLMDPDIRRIHKCRLDCLPKSEPTGGSRVVIKRHQICEGSVWNTLSIILILEWMSVWLNISTMKKKRLWRDNFQEGE